MNLETKAYLISKGSISIQNPPDEISTAGPGAGGSSIFFGSDDKLVRLSIDPKSSLSLVKREEGVVEITENGQTIAKGSLIEPLAHCPKQAYITVCERCIYDCKFCAVPLLCGPPKSLGRVLSIVNAARSKGTLEAISLTSGVEVSPQDEVFRVASMVPHLKRFGVPIGVSVCPTSESNLILKRVGVDEVKYNIETVDPDLFKTVCPGLNQEHIMSSLSDAVSLFGKDHVTSNIIVGIGETDKVLLSGIDELVEMGVLPVLRAVNPHPLRQKDLEMVRPGPDRILRLARHLRHALDRFGLRGDLALTMCYRCTGCDLIPHRDL